MLEIADSPMKTVASKAFRLPPLILHPFTSSEETSFLMESSRASLALQGLAPQDQTPIDELDRHLLRGRYAELRMLFYIGKDFSRWLEQCTESVRASAQFASRQIRPETFAVLFIQHAPAHVQRKLESWGVLDFRALFRRSFGLHAVFQELPEREFFSPDFIRRYHRYLDQWFEQRLRDWVFERPDPSDFAFELYASGEYSSMLEKSWAEETADRT